MMSMFCVSGANALIVILVDSIFEDGKMLLSFYNDGGVGCEWATPTSRSHYCVSSPVIALRGCANQTFGGDVDPGLVS